MVQYIVAYARLLGWIALPIVAGICLRRFGVPRKASKFFFGVALLVCHTIISFVAIWGSRIAEGAVFLPFLALLGWIFAALAGLALSYALGHGSRQKGAFVMVLCMSNQGYTLLGIIAFVLFGQEGLDQSTYAIILLTPFMVLVLFPMARYFGNTSGRIPFKDLIVATALDIRNIPLIAMILGLVLNISGVQRPGFLLVPLQPLVYVGTIASGVAIGLLFEGFGLKRFWLENLLSALFRVTIFPLFYFALACIAGLNDVDIKIFILFGIVPPAIFSNLISDLFGLDTYLSSSIFVVNTIFFLILVLPVYVYVFI
jgi:predicted permease